MPELKEEVEPKIQVAVGAFTRKIDRAKIEARGAPHDKAGFDAAALQAAAKFDNETWSGDQRRELLAYLRGSILEKGAEFTEADARTVAQLQAGSGAVADGKLRDETMAVLFAMGFRFSVRKAMPWEVRLELYPGELEDLDGWNREIDEKVTKKGGSYRDVSPPVGEGSIYVRIGRSIVACYRGRGGPPSPIYDDAKHVAVPTKPGAYKLGPAHAHVTSNWYFSQIPWGAEIRQKRRWLPVSVARALRVVVGDAQPRRHAQGAARRHRFRGPARSDPRRRDLLDLEQERLRADRLEPRPERPVRAHDAGHGGGNAPAGRSRGAFRAATVASISTRASATR